MENMKERRREQSERSNMYLIGLLEKVKEKLVQVIFKKITSECSLKPIKYVNSLI